MKHVLDRSYHTPYPLYFRRTKYCPTSLFLLAMLGLTWNKNILLLNALRQIQDLVRCSLFNENHFMIDSKIPSSPIMMGLRVSSYIHAFFIRIIRNFEPWMNRKFCVQFYPYPQLCAYNTWSVLIFYLDMLFGSATESFTTFEKKVMKSEPQVFLWKWFLQKNVRVGRNSKQKPYVSYKNRDNFCSQPLSPSSIPPTQEQ